MIEHNVCMPIMLKISGETQRNFIINPRIALIGINLSLLLTMSREVVMICTIVYYVMAGKNSNTTLYPLEPRDALMELVA